ncbi:MAG: hypothetical protein JWL87_30 [Candidatus Adlerbacteria bacterium]|nr:hypothetical protein [Candidatus Adlerbacteria bacterium]
MLPADAPEAGEVYKHYKGDLYKIIGVALDSTDQWAVVYEPMYDNAAAPLFTRPLAEWSESLQWEDSQMQRFSKVEGDK